MGSSPVAVTVSDVIKSIDEKPKYYLFHVSIKRSHAVSFVEWKGNLKIGQALFHFDFSENYLFVPLDKIQSRHQDNSSCTLFTAMTIHFKGSKDNLLKKKPFIIVSDYMTHNKDAVSNFCDIISGEFSKSQPDLIINEWFLHSDGTAQHFKVYIQVKSMWKNCCCVSWIHHSSLL